MSQNEESKKSTGMTVIAEVADALASSAPTVRTRLVQTLTERELAKRVSLLDKALTKRDQLQKEVYMLRAPGKKLFQLVDGKSVEVSPVYTQEELKKLEDDTKKFVKAQKEATEKLSKFDALLESAFTAPSEKVFEKLEKQVAGKSDEAASEE